MVTVRTSKSKGSQFEYHCHASLKQRYEDILLTKQQGFQLQFDLVSHTYKLAVECKRLKAISWEQAKKYLKKLGSHAPEGYEPFLLFKSNHQPCLVMYWVDSTEVIKGHHPIVEEFEHHFKVPFIKHKSTRAKKGVSSND